MSHASAARSRGLRAPSLLLSLLIAGAGGPAAAADPLPANDGWVTDLAQMLDPQQERALEDLMESYRQGTSGNEIALLTVPDLGGRSLERLALEVARSWGLGQQDLHNGALLLVARDERKIRIEVGRGLEGNLTDLICGRIIRDVIAPQFKRGRIYEGLRSGIEALHAAAGGDYGKLPPERGGKGGAVLGLLPVVFFVLLIIFLNRRGRGGGGGLGTWLLLDMLASRRGSRGWHSGGSGGRGGGFSGGFGGFGGGGGFSGGGASGGW